MHEITKRLLEYMQKRKRIEIMLNLYENGLLKWGQVKDMLRCSDLTWRSACKELVDMGLAEVVPLDYLKNRYRLTDFGCLVAGIIKEKLVDLDTVIQSEKAGRFIRGDIAPSTHPKVV